jgi:hypothetical protein
MKFESLLQSVKTSSMQLKIVNILDDLNILTF